MRCCAPKHKCPGGADTPRGRHRKRGSDASTGTSPPDDQRLDELEEHILALANDMVRLCLNLVPLASTKAAEEALLDITNRALAVVAALGGHHSTEADPR